MQRNQRVVRPDLLFEWLDENTRNKRRVEDLLFMTSVLNFMTYFFLNAN